MSTPKKKAADPELTQSQAVGDAFDLGWQLIELRNVVWSRPGRARATLPPPSGWPLEAKDVFEVQLWTIQAAVHRIHGKVTDTSLTPPDVVAELVNRKDELVGRDGVAIVDQFLVSLYMVLLAADAPLGSALALGGDLAALSLEFQDDPRKLEHAADQRIFDRLRAPLHQLNSLLPAHTAKAILAALDNWEAWLEHRTLRGEPVDWAHQGQFSAQAFGAQADLWRQLLNGQRQGKDLLTLDDYVTAGEGLLRRYRLVANRFLAQWWPILAGTVLLAVVAIVLFASFTHGAAEVVGVVGSALSAVGITAKTATSTLDKVADHLSEEVWQAELDVAITWAATRLPGGDRPLDPPPARPRASDLLSRRRNTSPAPPSVGPADAAAAPEDPTQAS